jgi:hypothetical protein
MGMAFAVVGALAALVIDEITHIFGLAAIPLGSAEDAVRHQKLCYQEASGAHQTILRCDEQLFEIQSNRHPVPRSCGKKQPMAREQIIAVLVVLRRP